MKKNSLQIVFILMILSLFSYSKELENKEQVQYFDWAEILSSGKFYFSNPLTKKEIKGFRQRNEELFYVKVFFKNNIPLKVYNFSSKSKNNKPYQYYLFDEKGKISERVEFLSKGKSIKCLFHYTRIDERKEKMIEECDDNSTYIDYFYLPSIFDDSQLFKSESFKDGIKFKTVDINHTTSTYYIYDKNSTLIDKGRYVNRCEGIEPSY